MSTSDLDALTKDGRQGERRREVRYAIRCPVTALTPGRGRKRVIGRGWLRDINDQGARFELDTCLAVNDRISLEVHFSNPDGAVTTMRFQARVMRIFPERTHDVAVSFSRGGAFIRRKDRRVKNIGPIRKSGSGWIN